MRMPTNRTLGDVLEILKSITSTGAMEPGQMKALTKAVKKLRRAVQIADKKAISEAIDQIGKIFLRNFS